MTGVLDTVAQLLRRGFVCLVPIGHHCASDSGTCIPDIRDLRRGWLGDALCAALRMRWFLAHLALIGVRWAVHPCGFAARVAGGGDLSADASSVHTRPGPGTRSNRLNVLAEVREYPAHSFAMH